MVGGGSRLACSSLHPIMFKLCVRMFTNTTGDIGPKTGYNHSNIRLTIMVYQQERGTGAVVTFHPSSLGLISTKVVLISYLHLY